MIPVISFSELETDERFSSILTRELTFDPEIETSVRNIVGDVRKRGDEAVLEYTRRFDDVELDSIECVSAEVISELHASVSEEFLVALREAIDNVRSFHELQLRKSIWTKGGDGIRLGLRYTPLAAVGLYVPGGLGAYPSTIVMNAVPAQVAGVERIAVVTPPGQFRENPHVAAALYELGISNHSPCR